MFGIGGFELFIILLFGFLLFGPDKLPEIAKTLGAALRKFQQAQSEMEAVIKEEVLDPEAGKKKSASAKPAPNSSTETFAERKARYDRERAERLNRTQQEAARTEMKKEAAEKAAQIEADQAKAKKPEPASAAEASAPAADAQPAASAEAEAKPASTAAEAKPAPAAAKPAPSLSPDELFGNKPIKPTPAAAQAAAAESAPASAEAAAKPSAAATEAAVAESAPQPAAADTAKGGDQ